MWREGRVPLHVYGVRQRGYPDPARGNGVVRGNPFFVCVWGGIGGAPRDIKKGGGGGGQGVLVEDGGAARIPVRALLNASRGGVEFSAAEIGYKHADRNVPRRVTPPPTGG